MDLWEAVSPGRRPSAQRLMCWNGSSFEGTTWDQVFRDAEAMTAGLRKLGVRDGARVACLFDNTALSVRGLMAVWLSGGVVVSLPSLVRSTNGAASTRQLDDLCRRLGAVALIGDGAEVEGIWVDGNAPAPVRSWESLVGSGRIDCSPPSDGDSAFIQLSSGSTGPPKGCELTAGAIARQVEMILEVADVEYDREVAVGWVPLSHDMGMFGCILTTWAHRIEMFLSTPRRFMMLPRTWFGDAAAVGATVTAGTSTGLDLTTRANRRKGLRAPLSLRMCMLGAERVEAAVLARAIEVFAHSGLTAEHLMPAYGLAEATLMVTATPRYETPRTVSVDARALGDFKLVECPADHPNATVLVSAGVPCRGVKIHDLSDTELHEIRVSSPSLARSYYGDRRTTVDRLVDGSLRTGDLGFEIDGWLYPVGRTDDMLKVGGSRVYANEIETAVGAIRDLRPGRVALVTETTPVGRSELVMLVEPVSFRVDVDRIASEAAATTFEIAGVALDRCVFVPKGAIPKTPSGKLQRHRCSTVLADPRLQPLVAVDLSGSAA